MGEFVGDQVAALARRRPVLAGREADMRAGRERHRRQLGCCRRVRVDPNLRQVPAKARFEIASRGQRQRRTALGRHRLGDAKVGGPRPIIRGGGAPQRRTRVTSGLDRLRRAVRVAFERLLGLRQASRRVLAGSSGALVIGKAGGAHRV